MIVYPAQHDCNLRCREVLQQDWDNGLSITFRMSLVTVIFQFCAATYNYEVYISNDTNEISLTGV